MTEERELRRQEIFDRDVEPQFCSECGAATPQKPTWTHEAADAFWEYWRENGETHKHGYYESTWGAIDAAIKSAGVARRDRQSEGGRMTARYPPSPPARVLPDQKSEHQISLIRAQEDTLRAHESIKAYRRTEEAYEEQASKLRTKLAASQASEARMREALQVALDDVQTMDVVDVIEGALAAGAGKNVSRALDAARAYRACQTPKNADNIVKAVEALDNPAERNEG